MVYCHKLMACPISTVAQQSPSSLEDPGSIPGVGRFVCNKNLIGLHWWAQCLVASSVCTILAPDIKPGSRNIETYNTARFQYGYKGIHHIIHYTLVSWSLQDIHLRLVYQRLTSLSSAPWHTTKTKCHRRPSLMSYNISEIDVNSIKSTQIKNA